MAKDMTKAKTEPAADEDQMNATAPTTEEGQEPTPAATTEDEHDMTTPQSADADSSPCRGAMETATYVVDSKHGLNLRKAPKFGAKVLTVLPDGEEITVALGVDGPEGWLPVLDNDSVCGWVCARFVKKLEE